MDILVPGKVYLWQHWRSQENPTCTTGGPSAWDSPAEMERCPKGTKHWRTAALFTFCKLPLTSLEVDVMTLLSLALLYLVCNRLNAGSRMAAELKYIWTNLMLFISTIAKKNAYDYVHKYLFSRKKKTKSPHKEQSTTEKFVPLFIFVSTF